MGARRLVPLLAAIALGFALGWLVREGTQSPAVGGVGEGPAPVAPTLLPEDRTLSRPDPAASLVAAGTRSVAGGPAPAPTTAAGATSASEAAAPALPVIELTVVAGPGTPPDWKGTAYLVAAGATGAQRPEELPHAEVTLHRPVRLLAPAAGLYDVGIVNEGMQLLETDVPATPEGTRIRRVLPPMAPVRFRLGTDVPPDEPDKSILARVRLQRADEPTEWTALPGRGEQGRGPWVTARGSAGSTFETPPILVREAFTLGLDVLELWGGNVQLSAQWELTAEPRTVHGGDLVTLSIVPLGTLKLVMTAAPPLVNFPRRLLIEFKRADGEYTFERGLGDLEEDDGPRRERALPLGAGSWTVTWSGPNVAPGRLEGVEVRSGAATQVAIELRYLQGGVPGEKADDQPVPIPPSVPITVDPPLGEQQKWHVYARGVEPGRFRDGGRGNPSEASGDLRGRVAVIAIGEDRVSEEEVVPATGTWRPRLVRPGFVMCASTRLDSPAQGFVTIRRPDGFPLPVKASIGSPELTAMLEARFAPGAILGPFAPGPLELELFAARRSLGVVRLSITAGAIVPLAIPGR